MAKPDSPLSRLLAGPALAGLVALAGLGGVMVGSELYPPDARSTDPISAYVDESYRTFFDRRADPTSLAHWQQAFAGGLTREQFIETLVGSQEWREVVTRHIDANYLAKQSEVGPDGITVAPEVGSQFQLELAALDTDEFEAIAEAQAGDLVSGLRRVLLGQSSPSFDSEVTAALRRGGRTAAVEAALRSAEVAERRVRHAFRIIDRVPRQEELDRWVPVVAAGSFEELLVWLASTDRYARLAVEYRS